MFILTRENSDRRKKILLADDDRDLVAALSIRLRAVGFDVIQAYAGTEAYELALENSPDLIILDVRMPAGGGFTAIDMIKHSMKTRDIPVIFLTAFDDEEILEKSRIMGAVACFRKPFDDVEFMGAIRKVLDLSEGRS